MKKNKIKPIIFFAVLLPAILQAQTIATWKGNISYDWNTSGNWENNAVPDMNTEVTIQSVPTPNYYPKISSTATAKTVTVAYNAELKLEGTLEAEEITNNGKINDTVAGTIKLGKSLTNSGTLKVQTVELADNAGNEIAIKGSSTAANMEIGNLMMEYKGGKTLKLDGKIEIKTALKLSGTESSKSFLVIEGGTSPSEITLTGSGEGNFLEIDTDKVKITGNNFTAKNSKQKGGKRPDDQTAQNGWKFPPVNLEWTGKENINWENLKNWNLMMVPSQQDNVTIPSDSRINYWPKLTTSSDAKAKTVTVTESGFLDLTNYTISASSSDKSKMDISGTLKLEYTSDQKNWFKQTSPQNKITLNDGSTVEINGNSSLTLHNAETYNGGFKNLAINQSVDTTVTSESPPTAIKVKNTFNVMKGKVILDAELEASKVTVGNNGGALTAKKKLTISSELKNKGDFKSENDVILRPENNETIKVIGNMAESKTEFKNLICQNAGGKTLNIEGKIKVTNNLKLSGASSSNKLTVNGSGNAAVYLDNSQDNNGQYLKVYTENIKINEGDFAKYYKLKDSEDNSGEPKNKNGWVFIDTFELKNSFIRVNGNELYIVFKRNTVDNEFTHSTLKIKNNSTDITSSSTSQLPVKYKTISGPLAVWKYTLDKNISANEILQKGLKIEIKHFNKTYSKSNISDVGIGLTDVLFAANSRTIRDFSGEKDLPKLNTMIVTALAGTSNNVKLYLSVDNPGFWYPPSAQVPTDGIIGASKIDGSSDYSGESEGGKIKFTVIDTDSNFKEGGTAQFMFLYDGWLPCARLKNPSDILSFDVWKFVVIGVRHQRGGVSIFNNVINPDKGEKASIQIFVQKKGTLTIQVMTLDGNIVKTLERSQKSGGTHFYYWDGKNNSGVSVARGMYFIRIAGPDIDETRKVMITRD
ncbi:FlgD immunoglobulin-like domain containing protein [Treponema pedis]|uniref:FlgD immunoglobulin-like domain containing protein n=1 Tax=Treponema pedis TaxID=409322 RepID=UPI0004679BC8|nr:FlgD immunoglobulin-like domain containing protein [Treponema pedis]